MIVSGFSSAAYAQSPTINDLDQVKNHLQSLKSFSARFIQLDYAGKQLSGTLLLKQPGRIRFQYQYGANFLIVGDGKSLNLIDYDVRQVQRWPIKNSPLGILTNPDRDIHQYGRLLPSRDPNIVNVMVRDPARPEYGTLTLKFVRNARAPAGLLLDGWTTVDAKNNRTSVQFLDQKYGVAIKNSAFRWNDPRRRSRGPRR